MTMPTSCRVCGEALEAPPRFPARSICSGTRRAGAPDGQLPRAREAQSSAAPSRACSKSSGQRRPGGRREPTAPSGIWVPTSATSSRDGHSDPRAPQSPRGARRWMGMRGPAGPARPAGTPPTPTPALARVPDTTTGSLAFVDLIPATPVNARERRHPSSTSTPDDPGPPGAARSVNADGAAFQIMWDGKPRPRATSPSTTSTGNAGSASTASRSPCASAPRTGRNTGGPHTMGVQWLVNFAGDTVTSFLGGGSLTAESP
jgi:hypothetical protein